MATRHQILYVNKVPRQDIHHAIAAIGGKNRDGTAWRMPLDKAVSRLIERTSEFYVAIDGYQVEVLVATAASGHRYLKTEADSVRRDNLLSLQEFPTSISDLASGLAAYGANH